MATILCVYLYVDMHIGKKIKFARISREMTQQELADAIHKTRPLISSIEQTGHVNIHTFQKICAVLDLDPDEFENAVNEPASAYHVKNSAALDKLESENLYLRKEIDRLQELNNTYKEMIEMLKEKIAGKK